MLITLLLFMPGSYDPLAAPLSMMAWLFGFAGLLLITSVVPQRLHRPQPGRTPRR